MVVEDVKEAVGEAPEDEEDCYCSENGSTGVSCGDG